MAYTQMLDWLLKHGADVDAIDEGLEQTPLMYAASFDNIVALIWLIEHGAQVNAVDSSYKQTALMKAVVQGHVKIVQYLVNNGADVNMVDNSGNTAMDHTFKQLDNLAVGVELIKILLEHGALLRVTTLNSVVWAYKEDDSVGNINNIALVKPTLSEISHDIDVLEALPRIDLNDEDYDDEVKADRLIERFQQELEVYTVMRFLQTYAIWQTENNA